MLTYVLFQPINVLNLRASVEMIGVEIDFKVFNCKNAIGQWCMVAHNCHKKILIKKIYLLEKFARPIRANCKPTFRAK